MLPPVRTAHSIGLLTGEVGVEYMYGDSAICARVHSIEESVRTVSTRRPSQAFDKHSVMIRQINHVILKGFNRQVASTLVQRTPMPIYSSVCGTTIVIMSSKQMDYYIISN